MPRARSLSDHAVLERAADVFWRNGYAATSLRDLTQATGLSASALYHRFRDKDGLFVEALQRYADDGLRQRLAGLAATTDPLQAIASLLEQLARASAQDAQRRGCLLVNTVLDGAPMSEAAREVARARLGEIEVFFAQRLRQAVAMGLLAPDTDTDGRASALLGAVLAVRVLARLDDDATRMQAVVTQALAGLQRTAADARPVPRA